MSDEDAPSVMNTLRMLFPPEGVGTFCRTVMVCEEPDAQFPGEMVQVRAIAGTPDNTEIEKGTLVRVQRSVPKADPLCKPSPPKVDSLCKPATEGAKGRNAVG